MKINYPETILDKSLGTTEAEQYLSKLCNKTFLSMWSYANIFRDQGRKDGKGDGKEVCDLLAVFEDHVFIFSDKNCGFPESGNLGVDWSRWYKKAVRNSAEQIFGAERWIFRFNEKLFLDKSCTTSIPFPIPPRNKAKIHRIVVAHSVSDRCRKEMGGSGSMMLLPGIVGDQHCASQSGHCMPFAIGQVDPGKGYVHVFDDVSLEIVMKTLDTISDFSRYLDEKERYLSSSKHIMVTGEENLLAHYLKHADSTGAHVFPDQDVDGLMIGEDLWDGFKNSPQRKAQVEENEISYSWDALVESFINHVFSGTSQYMSHPDIKVQEEMFRVLARENRTRRRLLAKSIYGLLEKTPPDHRATRTILPSTPGDPYYVFLLLPNLDESQYETYREVRRELLSQYLYLTRHRFPNAKCVVGVATDSGLRQQRSEDFLYLDTTNWSESDNAIAEKIEKDLKDMGLLSDKKWFSQTIKEYPDSGPSTNPRPLKGSDRNKPCVCGSGKKYKKCCGKI